MIQPRAIVKIADNTGAKIGRIFKVLGGSKKRYARIGELVVLSVQVAEPKKLIKKHEVCRALVVRSRAALRRADGSYVRFDDNAVVILDKEKPEPRGSRVFGPIPREIAERGYQAVATLAPEIV